MDQQTVTLIIAIWGAVVATGVGIWDVVKWKTSGARLRVFANGNMACTTDDDRYILVRVENIGDAPTTLKMLSYWYFKTRPSRLFRSKPDGMGIFNTLIANPPKLPHKLDPGSEWTHVLPLSDEVREMSLSGYFYLVIEDTMTDSAYRFQKARIVINISNDKMSDSVLS